MKDQSKLKECFVIMPISDNTNYPKGHFHRVYNFIIKPAVEIAGFKPVRADDIINTNYIALDIIKRIIESDMAICDLSSQNPNVLYELGIRQAFDKPITLIKDKSTSRIFDIQGFRDFEYDMNLRIDNVQNEIEALAEIIESTYNAQKNDINSLISLLSIRPAKNIDNKEISSETELILNVLGNLDKRIGLIERSTSFDAKFNRRVLTATSKAQIIPADVGHLLSREELLQLKPGDKVYHVRFGYGKIEEIHDGSGSAINNLIADVEFESGVKRLLLSQPGSLYFVA